MNVLKKWKSEEFTLAGKLDFFLNSPLGISEADLGKASVEPGFPYAIWGCEAGVGHFFEVVGVHLATVICGSGETLQNRNDERPLNWQVYCRKTNDQLQFIKI